MNDTLSNLSKHEKILAICLGAFFLSEFLLIHPFYDGNGRTARILLSHIIRPHTVVPLSLYSSHDPSSAYLKALEAEGRTIPWAVLILYLNVLWQIVKISTKNNLDCLYPKNT